MSFLVAQRTREIGVRMALGATPGQVLWSTMQESGRWTVVGVTAGVIGSIIAARLLAAAVLVLSAAAALATLGPARRAALLDPMTILRQEYLTRPLKSRRNSPLRYSTSCREIRCLDYLYRGARCG